MFKYPDSIQNVFENLNFEILKEKKLELLVKRERGKVQL